MEDTIGQLGLVDATIEDHASYLERWIKVLKADKRAIFTAANQAAKASEFIMVGQSRRHVDDGVLTAHI